MGCYRFNAADLYGAAPGCTFLRHHLCLQDLRDFLLTGQVPSSAPEIVKEASKATKASKASASSKATKARADANEVIAIHVRIS